MGIEAQTLSCTRCGGEISESFCKTIKDSRERLGRPYKRPRCCSVCVMQIIMSFGEDESCEVALPPDESVISNSRDEFRALVEASGSPPTSRLVGPVDQKKTKYGPGKV